MLSDKHSFLISNLLKGFLWLLIIIAAYVIAKKYFHFSLDTVLGSSYNNVTVVYLIFLFSEIIFGIFPPELFMIWALRDGIMLYYIYTILALSIISYLAGCFGLLIGRYLSNTVLFKALKNKVFGRYEKYLYKYGGFLVIVASLTPLPFSGIAMLVGSVKFSLQKYLVFSLFRFLRFIIYSIIIWNAQAL